MIGLTLVGNSIVLPVLVCARQAILNQQAQAFFCFISVGHITNYSNQHMAPCQVMDVAPRDAQQPLRGSKKRFHECLDYNLTLIREGLPDENLIYEQFVIGRRGKKKVVIAYLKDVADPGIVTEVINKIKAIKAETLFDSSYLERNIEDSNLSPFPQVEVTTQPDLTEAALIQGRIAILLDGSGHRTLFSIGFSRLCHSDACHTYTWYKGSSVH